MLTGVKAVETFCVVSTAFNFAPQTATNRLCGICSACSGTNAHFLFARNRVKFDAPLILKKFLICIAICIYVG